MYMGYYLNGQELVLFINAKIWMFVISSRKKQ